MRVLADQRATAEIGITLARTSQGAGVATEALTAVLGELFEQGDIHRVFAETDDGNLAVGRLLERFGSAARHASSRLTGSGVRGGKTPEEIRACADAILNDFDEMPVRSFVLTIADRRIRECLRENECAALSS